MCIDIIRPETLSHEQPPIYDKDFCRNYWGEITREAYPGDIPPKSIPVVKNKV